MPTVEQRYRQFVWREQQRIVGDTTRVSYQPTPQTSAQPAPERPDMPRRTDPERALRLTPVQSPDSKPKRKKEKKYNLPLVKIFTRILSDGFGKKKPIETSEIGLEIETEGKNLFRTPISYWQVHNDDSLRDGETGERGGRGPQPPVEYVLRKPLKRDELQYALDYLSTKLKEAKSEIQNSPRTSVHVHVNMQPHTMKEIYNYICLYLIFEELLVSYAGEDREGNLFCLRAKDAEYIVDILSDSARRDSYEKLVDNNWRYASCNFASLGKFGTLEFRALRGTVDTQLIQQWVDILLTLKDRALQYENPRDILEQYNRLGSYGFFKNVFDSRVDLGMLFVNRDDLLSKIENGYGIVKDVVYSSSWDRPIEKSDEPEWDDHMCRYSLYAVSRYMISNFGNEMKTVSMDIPGCRIPAYNLGSGQYAIFTPDGHIWDRGRLAEDSTPNDPTETDMVDLHVTSIEVADDE